MNKNNKTIKQYNNITLNMGGGGKKSEELISSIRKILNVSGKWENAEDDSAVFDLGKESLVFTTDAFIVDPLFFPGGDIGKISICGTLNDLAVMGAKPIGISLSLIIEEGFPRSDLERIIKSIQCVSKETGVPIVTGDTKVTEKGKIDKIEITTSGIGLTQNVISNNGAKTGDVIISSGNLGEHSVALLATRFNYKTKVKSDCQPLVKEIQSVAKYLTSCKDPTRGGVATVLNEMSEKSHKKFILEEKNLPFGKETIAISKLLGIDFLSFPSEGRFVATVSKKDAEKVLKILQKFNRDAKIIGRVERPARHASPASNALRSNADWRNDAGGGVWLETSLGGTRRIETPGGKLIPRIC